MSRSDKLTAIIDKMGSEIVTIEISLLEITAMLLPYHNISDQIKNNEPVNKQDLELLGLAVTQVAKRASEAARDAEGKEA